MWMGGFALVNWCVCVCVPDERSARESQICNSFGTNAVEISDIKQHFVSFKFNKRLCGFDLFMEWM